MSYIPPARSGDPQQSSGDSPSGALHDRTNHLEKTLGDLKLTSSSNNPIALFADIHKHYWAPQSNDGDDCSSPPATLPIVLSHSTLNGSALDPDKLQYVMLFKDANPRWASDGIIFVKSSLHLLPGYEQAKDDYALSVIFTGSMASEKSNAQQFASPEGENLDDGDNAMDCRGCSDKQNVSETVKDKLHPRKVESAEDGEKTMKDLEKQKQSHVDTESNKSPTQLASHQVDSPKNTTNPEGDAEVTSTATHPSYSPDLSQNDTGPIAIFEQVTKRQDGHFRSAGYYQITNLQYLPPQSADLYRMLEQKFSTIDRFGRWKQNARSAASWNASMSFMWAVIKMERDEEANARLGPPNLTKSRTAQA